MVSRAWSPRPALALGCAEVVASMERCWARTLSGCSDKLSREHLLSRAVFPEGVTVRGLPWCPEPKAVGANALVARCLCTKHNSELSPLDRAARDLWDKLAETGRLSEVRGSRPAMSGRWSRYTFRANGYKIERWCLKVLCNVLASDSIEALADWEPPPELVRRVFGVEPFPERCGLAVLARVGDHLSNEEHIGFGGIRTDGTVAPFGCTIDFRSLRFAATWARPVEECVLPDERGGKLGIPLYHFKAMHHVDTGVELRFDW